MDHYRYPCLQLASQNCNAHMLQRVIQQFFPASPFRFNFCASQLYFEGLAFYFEGLSFLSPLLCALCCFEGCQRAPGSALGRQALSTMLPVHLNLFLALVSLLFAHPHHTQALLFSDSPQQCTPHHSAISEVLMVLGENWDTSLSKLQGQHQALLLLWTHAVHSSHHITCTLQQHKPALYYLPTTACSAWCSLCFGNQWLLVAHHAYVIDHSLPREKHRWMSIFAFLS